MRVVNIGSANYTEVFSNDEVGPGNAYHDYVIQAVNSTQSLGSIKFQKGPIKESGVNGCHNEDLIAIVIDRLQCFQSSPYSCRENALALTKLEEALHWLNSRTSDRKKRGVEGTHKL
jgi:hypothetical protein